MDGIFVVGVPNPLASEVREAVKNYLADFSVKGGGYPPFPVRKNCKIFSVKGGWEYPPTPLRENSVKKTVPLVQKLYFSALFGRGDAPPNSAKLF